MRLREFQKRAWHVGRGYPRMSEGGTIDPNAISFPGLRIAEEVGEVVGVIKRKVFKHPGSSIAGKELDALEDELGDVLHAVAQVATEAGLRLDVIAERALEKHAERGRGVRDWPRELTIT